MEILIIKLGAKGDVIRTICLATALKRKYENCKITWITKKNNRDLLTNHPDMDSVLSMEDNPTFNINFDHLYNFDIEKEASDLAIRAKAGKKYGFYVENDFAVAFNLGAEYYINTIFDDELKKNNKKTYQEMMFEAAELGYEKILPKIYLNDKDKEYAENFAKKNSVKTEKLIGIHMGSSPRWPSKIWSETKIKEFIKKAKKEGYEVLLFGGPNELERQDKLFNELKNEEINILRNDVKNTDREFASLVDLCKVMICSDSFALHVALGLQKKTIGLFFCTNPNEIESYGLLTKIVSKKLWDFFPERMDEFDEDLVNSVSADEVFNEVKKSITFDPSILLKIDEGDIVNINNISLEVLMIDSEVNVDRSTEEIKVTDAGRNMFLKDGDNNEYHIWVSQDLKERSEERIKRKFISEPWDYEIIEEINLLNSKQ